MRTIRFKLPTIEQVEFILTCLPEDTPIKGNAMASGDDEADKKLEDDLIEQLENGNEWAWCCVKVTARYKGMEGTDYLGCCSYKGEEDFKRDGYYEDMKQQAYQELLTQLESLKDK